MGKIFRKIAIKSVTYIVEILLTFHCVESCLLYKVKNFVSCLFSRLNISFTKKIVKFIFRLKISSFLNYCRAKKLNDYEANRGLHEFRPDLKSHGIQDYYKLFYVS